MTDIALVAFFASLAGTLLACAIAVYVLWDTLR